MPTPTVLCYGLPTAAVPVSRFRELGITGLLVVLPHDLQYQALGRALTEAEVRAAIGEVMAAAGGLPVWLVLWCIGPGPQGAPQRTFWGPKETDRRAVALANYGLIARVAQELGVAALGFDFEAYEVPAGNAFPTYGPPNQIGREIAGAIRQAAPSLRLFGLGPLYAGTIGLRALLHGYFLTAGREALLLTEDTYGMGAPADVRQWLHTATQRTGAPHVGAGWWLSTERPVAKVADCIPALKAALQVSPYLMLYRDGDAVLTGAWGDALQVALKASGWAGEH